MKITMNFEFEGTKEEVLAEVSTLLLGPNAKVRKPRKKRTLTDEQKAEFRARMVAGQEAKAKTADKPVVEVKPAVEPMKPEKSVAKPKPSPKVTSKTKGKAKRTAK